MCAARADSTSLLTRALASERIHSAYLLSGAVATTRAAALDFARALGCMAAPAERPCEACDGCRRSQQREPIAIDGTGKRGPMYRHVGDHPDLFWLERGEDDTRLRIGQIRALQHALRLAAHEGGWRAAVIADAEWLNQESQNALLRLLEEPPDRTCLLLVASSAAGLLATIRSRCQRVVFPLDTAAPLRGDEASDEVRSLVERLDKIAHHDLPSLLDWAEEYRGQRAAAAESVMTLVETASLWLRERVSAHVQAGGRDVNTSLAAFHALLACRRDLAQRNANPQMVAERALLAVCRAGGR